MAVSISQGTNNKPVASNELVKLFSALKNENGELFIGYPVIASPDGRYPIDAVWVSPNRGLIIFDLVQGDPSGFQDRQDDLANKLEARLKTHKELMDRRDLVVKIHTISFAPGLSLTSPVGEDSTYSLVNEETLSSELRNFEWHNHSSDYYNSTLSALQSISTIRKSRARRSISNPNSRGAKLKKLEESIATLDSLQAKAVIETVRGVQRIRGLAGSGKTIVLALKAAYLHSQHPEWRIAVTFNTRALKGQLKRLINTFSIEQTGEEPDWEQIKILNAWGAPGGEERDGIYHQFCRAMDVPYLDFSAAKKSFNNGDLFGSACSQALALTQSQEKKQLYDAILIDEAQDFPSSFLRLCYEIIDSNKRLVYAYDELQNLSGTSVATPEEIFGANRDGTPRVTFPEPTIGQPKSDIILERCYRNSRPVLVAAHALGFGIYRNPPRNQSIGLIQMFSQPELWREIGYEVKEGELQDGSNVVIKRSLDASPEFLEEHSPPEDLIQFLNFNNELDQSDWVVKQIINDLRREELSHDDIVVINPDPRTTREKVGLIRRRLLENGINSHLAGVDTDPDVFFKSDSPSITFSGIHRAKGNEAGMVYIINAHDCHSTSENLATIRNRLFTAITRSKAWVRVLGIGSDMQSLIDEYNTLKENQFELRFRYPTQLEREQMSIVHRDISEAELNQRNNKDKKFAELIESIKSGEFDEGKIAELKESLESLGFSK